MINKIKHTVAVVQAQDMNKSLRHIFTYAWIGTGVFFACYIYLIGSITFSVVKQRGLEQTNKTLISQMSEQELAFLSSQQSLTLASAAEFNLVPAPTVAYTAPTRAFAWNVGR